MKREDIKALPPEKIYTDENPKPKMNSLVQLTQYMAALDNLIAVSAEQNDGEIDMDLEEQLIQVVERELPNKTDAYGYVLDQLKARKDFFSTQMNLMRNAVKAADAMEERLKGTVEFAMTQLGTDEIQGNQWRFKSSQSPGALEVTHPEMIPENYVTKIATIPVSALEEMLWFSISKWASKYLETMDGMDLSDPTTEAITDGLYEDVMKDLNESLGKTVAVQVDKDAVKSDIKMGMEVPGARLNFKTVIKKYANVTGAKKHDKRIGSTEAKRIENAANVSDDSRAVGSDQTNS